MAPASVKIRFTSDVKVKDHTGAVEFKAVEGEVCSLVPSSAQRWIRRGFAYEVSGDTKTGKGDPIKDPTADAVNDEAKVKVEATERVEVAKAALAKAKVDAKKAKPAGQEAADKAVTDATTELEDATDASAALDWPTP